MIYDQGNGGWWVQVNYHLVGPEAAAGVIFDDQFDLRLAGLFERMDVDDRVDAMMTAADEFARRHPNFTLQKPDSAQSFLQATKGFGVLWFKRTDTLRQNRQS